MKPKKHQTETVSFRADSMLLDLIDARRRPFGISRGEWVRGAITSYLNDSDPAVPAASDGLFGQLSSDVARLQQNLAATAYIILIKAAGMPAQEAQELIGRFFHK